MSKRLTTEEYVAGCIKNNGNKYDYSKTVFNSSSQFVTVTCKTHGDFETQKFKHRDRGDGCPYCSGRAMTQERAVNNFNSIHNDKYDYSKFVFKSSHKVSAIICRKHGEFLQSYSNHFHNKAGCLVCAGKQQGTTDGFTFNARAKHGLIYDYSKVDYKADKVKVTIVCKTHGDFSMVPSNHIQGQGCPKCAKHGYNVSKSGSLYVLTSENITKVGITNRNIYTRLREIRKSSSKDFILYLYFSFENGACALQIESQLLRELNVAYKSYEGFYDGSTECFLDVDRDALVDRITKLRIEALSNQ